MPPLHHMTAMAETNQQPNPSYVALIGDLVGSRDMDDRSSVQELVRQAIDELNEELGETTVAPITLTGGDEWKTLIDKPSRVVDVIDRMSDALHPLQVRWGAGRGELHTPLVEEVGALDGPCFHYARAAIEEASREKKWVHVKGFLPLHDEVLSALFSVLGALRTSWTDHQIEYIRAVRGRTQKEAARELGLDRTTVARGLGRAHYAEYRRGIDAISSLLATYDEGGGA